MVWLSFNFIALAAVIQNVLYIHVPSLDVQNIKVQLKTENYFGDLWIPLCYRIVNHTPTFQTRLPSPRDPLFYQYKLQVEFLNKSVLTSRDWITLGVGLNKETAEISSNSTINNFTPVENPTLNLMYDVQIIRLLYVCIIIIFVISGILLSKIVYHMGKSQCTLWFNK